MGTHKKICLVLVLCASLVMANQAAGMAQAWLGSFWPPPKKTVLCLVVAYGAWKLIPPFAAWCTSCFKQCPAPLPAPLEETYVRVFKANKFLVEHEFKKGYAMKVGAKKKLEELRLDLQALQLSRDQFEKDICQAKKRSMQESEQKLFKESDELLKKLTTVREKICLANPESGE
jgi:hypothetical protein